MSFSWVGWVEQLWCHNGSDWGDVTMLSFAAGYHVWSTSGCSILTALWKGKGAQGTSHHTGPFSSPIIVPKHFIVHFGSISVTSMKHTYNINKLAAAAKSRYRLVSTWWGPLWELPKGTRDDVESCSWTSKRHFIELFGPLRRMFICPTKTSQAWLSALVWHQPSCMTFTTCSANPMQGHPQNFPGWWRST